MKTLPKVHPLDPTRTVCAEIRPKVFDNPIMFQRDYGYAPATILSWSWSVSFGRWGAHVRFEDGRETFSFPRNPPIAAPFYEPDGSTNKHGWVYVRSPRFPQEKTISCPKCGSLDILLVGSAFIRGFRHEGYTRCRACNHYTSAD